MEKFNRHELKAALTLFSSLSSIEVLDDAVRGKLISAMKEDKNSFISIIEKIRRMNPENAYIGLLVENFYAEAKKKNRMEEII